MRVHATESEAWWIALSDEIRPTRGIDAKVIAEGLSTIFAFPGQPAEEKGGVNFLNGRLDNVLVQKMTVFTDGISVQVPTTTEDAQLILARALEFFFEIGMRRPITPPVHFVQSVVIADFAHPIDNLLPASLVGKIAQAMPVKGSPSILSLSTNFDAESISDKRWSGINPSNFKIERRAGVSYELNRYFCLANMNTKAHLEILEEFERLVART